MDSNQHNGLMDISVSRTETTGASMLPPGYRRAQPRLPPDPLLRLDTQPKYLRVATSVRSRALPEQLTDSPIFLRTHSP